MTTPDTKMLSAERLETFRSVAFGWRDKGLQELFTHIDAQAARIAELEREKTSKSDYPTWAENRIRELESELAAARAPVEESEIAKSIAWLVEQAGTPCPEDRIAADLITRLSRERDEARGKALEEAAKTCEHLRDAEFAKLPHHADEPDFSAEDVCAETVCAWHIRALKGAA